MLEPEIIEALNAIVKQNETKSNITPGKVEVVQSYIPTKEGILKIKLNGDLSEVFAHAPVLIAAIVLIAVITAIEVL